MRTTKTTCPYCGVGCGVKVQQDDSGAVTVTADKEHPANQGRLCSKGTALAETLVHPDRLLYPEINGQRVDWETASTAVADKFRQVMAEHGPDAVAFYVSGQLLTEDYYVANKLMKGFMGSANIDTNSRLCMSSAVAAHKRAFGEDLVPCSYEDLDLADLIVLVGSNAAWCHPVLYQRMVKAKKNNPALRVVLIDPRRTQTADLADLHLPLQPGSDAYLFNGLLGWLVDNGSMDDAFVAEHTSGLQAALQAVRAGDAGNDGLQTLLDICGVCGLSAPVVQQFFQWFAASSKVVTVFSQGINQSSSGVDKGNAIINCHLLTGKIGKPGCGPFSFTGQPNAMGGREVGGLANQLAAHLELENPAHRALVQDFWQAPALPDKAGLKAVELFEAMRTGKVKAVWIMATNPVVSLPDSAGVREALARCECVVVSDCVRHTETTRLADICLPALTWGERDGTVTNTDRTISRQRPFLAAPGEAKQDWEIMVAVARKLGFAAAFPYQSAAEVFREHAALSVFRNEGERCFNLTGLTDLSPAAYDALEPVQWPLATSRLFTDGQFYTPDRRARFVPVKPRLPVAAPTTDYPLVLNTGRVRDHWHTLTRTGLSARLSAHVGLAYAELHPEDARQRGIAEGSLVRVLNTLGEIRVRARVSANQQRGSVFVPMHWNGEFGNSAGVGQLIPSVTDPVSGQPESKHAVVQVAAWQPVWHGFLVSRHKLDAGWSAGRQTEAPAYWACQKVAQAWGYELAGEQAPAEWAQFARHLLCQPDEQVNWIEYLDSARQTYRAARFIKGQLASCLFVSLGSLPLPPSDWLVTLFGKAALERLERQSLLTGKPAVPGEEVGKTVCACFNVGENTIRKAIAEQSLQSVAAIGQCLQAGTNCGSCLPELREMLMKTKTLE